MCSFTCQSCSDPVRDTLEALPGIGQVEYDPEKDLFILEYDAAKLKVPDILAAVTLKGMNLAANTGQGSLFSYLTPRR